MKTITFNDYNIHQGSLILVNKNYKLINNYQQNLYRVNEQVPDVILDHKAARLLRFILNKLPDNAITLVSGYRSFMEQSSLYGESIRDNGIDFTKQFVALPGHSEHQTGLAIDLALTSDDIDFICPSFPRDGVCEEFRQYAPDYGFIERYLKDKETITGIAEEPWHFRYVGYPHSKIITANHFALEEYIDHLKQFTMDAPLVYHDGYQHLIKIFYMPGNSDELLIDDDVLYQISGNNVDGFIVTLWDQYEAR